MSALQWPAGKAPIRAPRRDGASSPRVPLPRTNSNQATFPRSNSHETMWRVNSFPRSPSKDYHTFPRSPSKEYYVPVNANLTSRTPPAPVSTARHGGQSPLLSPRSPRSPVVPSANAFAFRVSTTRASSPSTSGCTSPRASRCASPRGSFHAGNPSKQPSFSIQFQPEEVTVSPRALATDSTDLRSRAAARLQELRNGKSSPRDNGSRQLLDTGDGGIGPTVAPITVPSARLSPGSATTSFPSTNSFAFGAGPNLSPPRGGRAPAQHSNGVTASSRTFSPGAPRSQSMTANDAIMVCYFEGEQPADDFPTLEGGSGMHVIVAAVKPHSRAERAGVKPGFAMTSLNGRTEFMRLPGWQVRLLLEAPITLGFHPAPGRAVPTPSVELRLLPTAKGNVPLGIPHNKAPWQHSPTGAGLGDTWAVVDEVVFKPTDDDTDLRGPFCWQPDGGHVVGPMERALSPVRDCSPRPAWQEKDEMAALALPSDTGTARYRNDRSPLRWLAPVLNQFMETVCADGSDDPVFDGDPTENVFGESSQQQSVGEVKASVPFGAPPAPRRRRSVK